jgi:hypothetical protein
MLRTTCGMALPYRVAWRCSGTVAACLHVLQALNALPTRTSCMPMMALMSSIFETCVHALGTHEPSCIGSPTRFFFMLEARGPLGAIGDAAAASDPSQQGGKI